MPCSSFFECWILSQLFYSPLSLSTRGSLVLCFLCKGDVICISEVIDISPSNLDSSLCFIQPSISHDELCMLNKQGDNIQPCCTPFPIWNQCIVPCPVLTVPSSPAYRFLRRSGIPISWRIFHSLLWSTQSKALKVKVKSLSRVGLCNPLDGNLPGSEVHGIFQARILE